MDTAGGAHIDGHGASNETLVAWKAIANGQEHHYSLHMGAKAATLTIDVTDTGFAIQENTFYGNEALLGVLALLRADVNQRAAPSAGMAGAPGSSSLLTQSLSPQGGGSLIPNTSCAPLVSPWPPIPEKCGLDADLVEWTDKPLVAQQCGGDCPPPGTPAPMVCYLCPAFLQEAKDQDKVTQCIASCPAFKPPGSS
jgi:hypothetical protein